MIYNSQLFHGMSIFVEVVNSGSFTLASQRTSHSTSYISKEINKLEARLGVRLMQRTTRTLKLTPEGESYYQQCTQIISAAQEAENALLGHQNKPSGLLKISCPVSFGIGQMKSIFTGFMDSYPEVDLELDLSNRKVDLVAEGFDICIRGTQQLGDSTLISRPLFTSKTVTVASPGYLATHGTPTNPAELVNHDLITYSYVSAKDQWRYIDNQGNKVVFQPKSKVISNNTEMELSLSLAGKGIVRIPAFYLKDELETGKLLTLFEDYQQQDVVMYIVYPSRKYMSSKVRCFIDYTMKQLGEV